MEKSRTNVQGGALGLKKVALVEDVQNTKAELEGKVTTLEGSISSTNTNLQQLGTRVSTNETNISNLTTEVNETKKSVSDGKSKVASAITGKGVSTSATATFDQMANNIKSISTLATETNDGTAVAGDILTSKVAYVKGNRIVGTMANRGAVNQSLALNGTYTIPAGYHNGQGKVTQSITNNGAVSYKLPINGTYTIPAGYHNGQGKVTQSITTKAAASYRPTTSNQTIAKNQYLSGDQTIQGDSNLVAGNIKSGVSIFGVAGSVKASSGYFNGDEINGNFINSTSYTYSQPISGWKMMIQLYNPYNGNDRVYFFQGGGVIGENFSSGGGQVDVYHSTSLFTTLNVTNNQFSPIYYLPLVTLSSNRKTLSWSWVNGKNSNFSLLALDCMYET